MPIVLYYNYDAKPIDLIYVVFVLVGGGTIVHSLVDGYIALYIYKAIPGLSKSGINNHKITYTRNHSWEIDVY